MPPPRANPSPCWATRRPNGWASTGSGQGSGSGSAGCGSPWSASSTRPPWPRRSTPQSWSASPPRRNTSASTGTPRNCTSGRRIPSNHHQGRQPARRPGQPGRPQRGRHLPALRALTAQADAAGAFDTLFLGLGAVALLVGAVGVANIMIISVLERRQEIGLRRALGATRGQIRIQFLSEAILLSLSAAPSG